MTQPGGGVYLPPAEGLRVGAVYLHVPIVFYPPTLTAVAVLASGLFQGEPDFARAWQDAPEVLRERGLPVLLLAKPRPVIVLKVGTLDRRTGEVRSVWVAPRYRYKERGAPNHSSILDLPVNAAYGLDEPGYLDFLHVALIPASPSYLNPRHHTCDLSPQAFDAVLLKLQAWLTT